MSSCVAMPGAVSSDHATSGLLRRFLQAYWLRPENAFWMTLRSEMLSRVPLTAPAIDLGCGDGVFGFLHCGGVFDPDFDVFCSVGKLDDVTGGHADMFDHVTDSYRPVIQTPPAERFDVGTDIKSTMLTKASGLRLYDRLVEHDCNRPLPFNDGSFETIYCNAAYWVENIDGFLRELWRIARPSGRIVLQVKLDSLARYTLERHRAALGDRFLDILGRGRHACWPTVTDRAGWESRFASAGLAVVEAAPFITRTHAHMWDVGLRPLAPLLVRMTRELSADTRSSIKRDWVALFYDLLSPFCHPALDLFATGDEPGEIQYVLSAK